MKNPENIIYIFGHQNPDTDSIASAIALADLKMKQGEINCIPQRLGNINKETKFVLKYFNVEEPSLITDATDKNVVLVDHNEFNQSANGIRNANILEIIDHHRIADIETNVAIEVAISPLGCTATLIYNKYLLSNLSPNKEIAGLLLSAILSDTLILTSPTTTEIDKLAVIKLSKIAEIDDYKQYGTEMLKAGSDIQGTSIKEILEVDRKKFTFGNTNAYVSQVSTYDTYYVINKKALLLKEMNTFMKQNEIKLFVLIITDLGTNDSTLFACGESLIIATKAFNINNNEVFLKGVVSRKSQIVPPLTKSAIELGL